MPKFTTCLVLLSGLLLSGSLAAPALASDAGPSGGGSDTPYVDLAPAFVTNYDGGGRLRYLKIDVSVRARKPTDEAVLHHMPYIRNSLVRLFSSQLEENISSTDGKEALRLAALEEIRRILTELDGAGAENILELYFTSFVIQQ
ncbi:MAG: flagellar basal body-associated FliL family protein [Gammaproteobacteria bacterium]|nr:flagellar basal body-associated FliL family protein [Gammaproteobacteria bacterium]